MNHQHTNSEDTITTLYVEILMPMSATWNIYEQTTKLLVENQRRPDVIIRTIERYPIAVEVKIDDKRGSNEEFLKAHEHYRKRRYKECLNECLKTFESCLKTICKKRNWQYDDKRSTVKDLIQIVFDNELIPTFMQSHFSALKSTLESGLPTVRNRQSGHGQGPTQVIVPEYIAGYALHLTASNILLLAKADEESR